MDPDLNFNGAYKVFESGVATALPRQNIVLQVNGSKALVSENFSGRVLHGYNYQGQLIWKMVSSPIGQFLTIALIVAFAAGVGLTD